MSVGCLPALWVLPAAAFSLTRVLQARFGSATGGVVLLVIPLLAIFNSCVLSLMTNARCPCQRAQPTLSAVRLVWHCSKQATSTMALLLLLY